MADDLLVAVAKRLAGMLRPGDTVAQLADDQFVIVCEGLEKPAHADAFASRIESAMECPFIVSGTEVYDLCGGRHRVRRREEQRR